MSSTQTDNSASRERELADVERVFAELGLLPDRAACERARARAHAAVRNAPSAAERAADGRQAAMLSLACELFAASAPTLAGEPGTVARLVDGLEDVLDRSRAQIARELLGRRELASLPATFATEALLALVEAGERRLLRLGFDLHDGPLQELLLLAEDLRLFRGQLDGDLAGRDQAALVRGRLDDLDARLTALERGLRRISTTAHAGALVDRPFAQALEEIVDAFAARTGIAPLLEIDGDPSAISASQRIALLSVVGEALNNVREHARSASRVQIEIGVAAEGVRARVSDDGRGFDVERALLSAAQHGRMGLAGIHERVRLLGGRCIVESRPGGPTTVSLSVPPWQPLAATSAADRSARPAEAAR